MESSRIMKAEKIMILFFLVLTACEKPPVPEVDKHYIMFEPGNEETYWFADIKEDSLHLGDLKVKNGQQLDRGIKYEFRIEEDTVHVKAYHEIELIKWYYKGTGADPEYLTMTDSVFIHEFSTHKDSPGHFIVQLPKKIKH